MPEKPDEFIPTRESLLHRLKDWEDAASWQEFFDTYKRLIYSQALKAGLTASEAEEVLQETVISVAKTMKEFKYNPENCTFKSWLGHLTRRRIADAFRKRNREKAEPAPQSSPADTPQTPMIERIPGPEIDEMALAWDKEWEENILAAACDRVKKVVSTQQYQIFDLYVTHKLPVREVAAALGVNAAQVYLARHRVSKLIRQEVQRLQRDPLPEVKSAKKFR